MLVTLADTKAYLGIPTLDTTYDTFLTDELNLVSDIIEAYCRRVFTQTTYTQTYYSTDYRETNTLETFQYPLISVTSVTEDSVLLDSALYRIHKPTGRIIRPTGYFFCATETVVIYSAGYSATPTGVKSVVLSIIQERYTKKVSGVNLSFGSDVQRISIPGAMSIDFDYSLSNNDRSTPFGTILGSHINILDYYRSDRAIVGASKITYVG